MACPRAHLNSWHFSTFIRYLPEIYLLPFRENTPVALRRHAQQNTTFDLKQYLKDKFAALIDNFEGQVVPSERPDRKYFFARRIGPYKQQGQTGKLKNLDLNCSVR